MQYKESERKRMFKVILAQLPVPSFTQNWKETRNVPLAAGYLKSASHAAGLAENAEVEILDRVSADLKGDSFLLETIISRGPDLVGFTCASWNVQRSLWLADALKAELPACTVVAGGPEVSPSSRAIIQSPAIDIGVIGEGESTFTEILAHLLSNNSELDNVKGVFFFRGGKRAFTPPRAPISDLACIPSPYLLGFLDPTEYDNVTLETVRGCPHRCKYCNYPKRFPRLRKFPLGRVEAEVAMARERGIRQVNIIDPSFEAGDRLREVCPLLARLNTDGALSFFTDLRAEAIDGERAELLSRAGFSSVEVGLQSTNPVALENVNRRLDTDKFLRGVGLMREKGIQVRVNVILGLPGDTLDGVGRTVSFLEDNGLSSCAVPSVLQLLPNTALREEAAGLGLEYQGEPPYYVLKTRGMGYGDIRSAIRLCEERFPLSYRLSTPFFDVPSLATYSCAVFPRSIEVGRQAELERLECPVTKVVMDLGRGKAPTSGFLARLSKKLSASPVLWFISGDPGREAGVMGEVLALLSRPNPYGAWNVVIETAGEFDLGIFKKLKSSIIHRSHFLDSYFCYRLERSCDHRSIPHFFAVLAPRAKGYRGAWLKELSGSSALFWSMVLGRPGDLAIVEHLPRPDIPWGALIDFSAGADRSFVLATLDKLRKSPLAGKPLQFRNRLLQHIWLCGGESVSYSGKVDELILFWAGGEKPRIIHLAEKGLLMDQTEWILRKKI